MNRNENKEREIKREASLREIKPSREDGERTKNLGREGEGKPGMGQGTREMK